MEKLSELMDGELDSHEASNYLGRIKSDPRLKENWELYHLVGDTIRKERVLASRISSAVSVRLAQEPTILSPRRLAPQLVVRYALSAAAGLAGVAVVAWVAFNTQPTNLAQAPRVEVAAQTQLATPMPVALASQEAEVEDYLLAHQSVSSFRTMHGSLPYMRASAADEAK
ncbi:MAG: sigma-E factor negative regulatory protein [Burkholderiales bacterium]